MRTLLNNRANNNRDNFEINEQHFAASELPREDEARRRKYSTRADAEFRASTLQQERSRESEERPLDLAGISGKHSIGRESHR
jgi:hypothetical protein